jgi:hypothetical protein
LLNYIYDHFHTYSYATYLYNIFCVKHIWSHSSRISCSIWYGLQCNPATVRLEVMYHLVRQQMVLPLLSIDLDISCTCDICHCRWNTFFAYTELLTRPYPNTTSIYTSNIHSQPPYVRTSRIIKTLMCSECSNNLVPINLTIPRTRHWFLK